MQATCLCWLDSYQRDENSWQQILRSPSSAPHLVAIYIFVFLYSWVRNSSLRDAIWKCKEWEVSPKRITDQTVEQWKCCSMKISYQHSRPHSEALHLKYVSCICNWAQCFLLWAVKQNWEENLENHSFLIFFFSVQLFSHSWARQELWDYLQIAYYLKCNLCNWSYQSYLFSQTKQFQDHKRGFSLVPPALPVRLPRWSLSDVFSHDFHFTDLFSGKKIC